MMEADLGDVADHHVMMTVDSVMDLVMTVDLAMIVDQETVLATVVDLAAAVVTEIVVVLVVVVDLATDLVETVTVVALAMIAAAVTVIEEVADSDDVMKEEMINVEAMIEIWMETGEGISCYVELRSYIHMKDTEIQVSTISNKLSEMWSEMIFFTLSST